ncbi:unnamed protein product [Schistosoma curassoni]|uniref:Ovule protein n=1 Tax=Schistosoma curassoni TaxID=6186 RepID=A0A183JLQ1_9TREM|nr:unnamed protein product [Schistosoma curassoni]
MGFHQILWIYYQEDHCLLTTVRTDYVIGPFHEDVAVVLQYDDTNVECFYIPCHYYYYYYHHQIRLIHGLV